MEITESVVVAINLMDEAKRKASVARSLSRDLGIPAIDHRARRGNSYLVGRGADVIEGKRNQTPALGAHLIPKPSMNLCR
jgi:Fe2+ transport system protein B